MLNFFDELSQEIYDKKSFKKQYADLFKISAMKQLEKIPNIRLLEVDNFDLKFLLEVANIFSQSSIDKFHNIAQRIAQFVVEFVDNSIFKQTASMILELLINKQAIKLAIETKKVPDTISYTYPYKFTLENLSRNIEYSFFISEEDIVECNKFQKEFIDGVEKENNIVSVSAPTSAGKSYIVMKWLKYHLELDCDKEINTAIIVPTRALINQFEQELKREFKEAKDKVNIISMPFAKSILTNKKKTIYVFTQERMNIFLSKNKMTIFNAVFVDESHKIGDNERGVLLQNVVDEIIRRNPITKVVFAGPFVKNPEDVYLQAAKIKSSLQTVDRNYFHISRRLSDRRRCPKKWAIELETDNTKTRIAKVNLNNALPDTKAKILGGWAYLVGNNDYGNLIYADGGAQAESIAEYIYELETNTYVEDYEINELIELCQTIVHKDFLLIKLLRKRIAFHYGSMPQLIRQKIEELFNKKMLKYVVCTSTLLEGVNLSCKNIFVKEPKKGNRQKMSGADLFNLLGRAGRLGKEFCGNIFFVDWSDAPVEKVEQIVERTTHNVLKHNFNDIISSFSSKLTENNKNNVEATVGYLFHQYLKTNDINLCTEVKSVCNKEQVQLLNNALSEYSSKIKLPQEILENHPTTYHYSMQLLLERFQQKYKEEPENITNIIPDLSEDNVCQSLIEILKRMERYFNTGIFSPLYAAIITSSWMKFKNLPTIIQRRIAYKKDKNENETFNTSVRKVFNDIDELARYRVPKLLSCYVDVMELFFQEIGMEVNTEQNKNIAMFLEYGINKRTQASLIILGLSRSTIFELGKIKDKDENILLDNENLTEEEALYWLTSHMDIIENTPNFPQLLINEIKDVIGSYQI